MRKVLSVLLAIAVVASCLVVFAACETTDEILYVYNWEDYIDMELLDEFAEWYESKTDNSITVKYSTFDTNETMITKVEKSNSKIDVVCPSEYAVQRLMEKGLLKDLNDTSVWEGVPGGKTDLWENINALIRDKVNANFGSVKLANYFAPYMTGTLGILYNADVIKEADLEKGFGLLWNEAKNEELDGKIYFKDSIRDAYAATVLYLKQMNILPQGNSSLGKPYSDLTVEELINCTDTALINSAENALTEQKKVNKGYSVDMDKVYLIEGSAYATLAWSGDALWAIEESELNLAYFVPEQGSNIWFDGWCIPKNAENSRAAIMFMQFMNQPENSVRNMLEIGYVSAISEDAIRADEGAKKLLSDAIDDGLFISHVEDGTFDDFFLDPIRYPEESQYDLLGVMFDFGEETDGVLVTMWERVKAQSDFPWLIVGIIAGIIALAAIVFIVYRAIQSNSNKKRKVN